MRLKAHVACLPFLALYLFALVHTMGCAKGEKGGNAEESDLIGKPAYSFEIETLDGQQLLNYPNAIVSSRLLANLGGVRGIPTTAVANNGIAAIVPPGEDGVGLPAGLVEYGESPEDAAVREVLEETGLQSKITECLGWHFFPLASWPGPMVQFFFVAEVFGGNLKGSEEGEAKIYSLESFPAIASGRTGSQMALRAYWNNIQS